MDPNAAKSPLGNFPELAAMYHSSFALAPSNAQASVQNAQDQVSVSNAKQAAADAKAKADAFNDPKNYTVVQRDDGGYGFYGPDGKEVTAAQYASVSGKLPADVLKDSKNPIDQRFIQDSKNLSSYFKAKAQASFDPKQNKVAQSIENDVKNAYGIDLAKSNPQDILNKFYSNYPTIYGANKGYAPGVSGAHLLVPSEQNVISQGGGAARFGQSYSSGGGFGGNPTGR